MPDTLLQSLPDGPLDIVGDVHGEMDALMTLLSRMGYQDGGRHPEGRRLVFVGDLTDRGPDSLAVVQFVHRCVDQGLAHCVLGNHDLNILLGKRKFDNGWFFGEEFYDSDGKLVPQRLASDDDRRQILDFFATLPLALHRPGLRVVHAYWDESFLGHIGCKTDAAAVHNYYADSLESYSLCRSLPQVEKELSYQNDNPVKLLTSGPVQQAAEPFESAGKLRVVERVPWWQDYSDPELCAFGHYSQDASMSRRNTKAICIDFGAYKRRQSDRPYKLAALRVPEMVIVCDDGTYLQLR
ncbi:metallophosphoesterase [Aeoliella mucimassa]|uniref:Bis(5'-nucleosyl)-tetraphosphatase PrpE [asymmetrical] n=1 Tax=Aeoliella mucimassa TaxID=2527972 RepID=A0A518AN37_9BACT|nr:metallophosphoesterase [Aeoliella mucimassa]QDU56133.1 Bis(5'-nucleosyl)-tetraphosphatase PrpE [asymmetrical] [Aeoliella mucimassa]